MAGTAAAGDKATRRAVRHTGRKCGGSGRQPSVQSSLGLPLQV